LKKRLTVHQNQDAQSTTERHKFQPSLSLRNRGANVVGVLPPAEWLLTETAAEQPA